MPCVGFNVQCNRLCGLKTFNYYRRDRESHTHTQKKKRHRGEARTETQTWVTVHAVVLQWTYCKAGEDISSCSHADPDHTVHSIEEVAC